MKQKITKCTATVFLQAKHDFVTDTPYSAVYTWRGMTVCFFSTGNNSTMFFTFLYNAQGAK